MLTITVNSLHIAILVAAALASILLHYLVHALELHPRWGRPTRALGWVCPLLRAVAITWTARMTGCEYLLPAALVWNAPVIVYRLHRTILEQADQAEAEAIRELG